MTEPTTNTDTATDEPEDRRTTHLKYMQSIADKLGAEAGLTATIDYDMIYIRESDGTPIFPSAMFYVTGSCHDDYLQVENAIERALLMIEEARQARADAPPAPAPYTLTATFTMTDNGDDFYDWQPTADVVIGAGDKTSVIEVEFPSVEVLRTRESSDDYDEMCAATIRAALLKGGAAADAGRLKSDQYICTAEIPESPCDWCNGHDRVVTWEFSVKPSRPEVEVSYASDDDFS